MATFQQNLSLSLRGGALSTQENRGIPAPDRRPYLVTVPPRKAVTSINPSTVGSRQFLALFPHESEDARITGATRSLYRRLLALNLPRTDVSTETHEVTELRFRLVDKHIA
jgi:hypothetical protein